MNLTFSQIFLKYYSFLFAKKAGVDEYGNTYFISKKVSPSNNNRKKRWIIYNGEVEASKVPQEWNAWLHHSTDDTPKKNIRKPKWFKKHKPNLTGTKYANKPKSVLIKNKINNIYSLWKPDD